MKTWTKKTVLSAGVLMVTALTVSCGSQKPPEPAPPKYETLPPKVLPTILRGTILERMDHTNPEPLQVSAYGLVVNLPGTGDGTAPASIREYIMREMNRRGFGTVRQPGYEQLTPQRVLDDPRKRAAIVRVDGFMPPGVRKGQTFDVVVSALPESNVVSLAGGMLYRTDLKFGGADTRDPAKVIDVQGRAEGAVFLNPTMSLNPRLGSNEQNASRISRRQGIILDGGMSDRDQPLVLRLRAPQRSVIRQIEARIRQQFLDPAVASAKDEAVIHLTIPESFKGDWERFIGVTMHLYLDGTPEVLKTRAKQLAQESLQPDAPLQNISFAWEGMGEVALPAITPLMSPKYPEDVQFAAARAAAFIGDSGAHTALMRIASTPRHQFQIDAVRTLGALKNSPSVNSMLRQLLSSESALVRVEAYKVLAANRDRQIFSVVLPKEGVDERFVLDVVKGNQPPIVYASRSGVPRIAIIGEPSRLVTPITFTALDNRLSISSTEGVPGITIFYRQEGAQRPIRIQARTDLSEIVGWLGGVSEEPDQKIDLSYGEVVAIVQALADQGRLRSAGPSQLAVNFMLQDAQQIQDQLTGAPPLIPRSRPQSEEIPGLPTSRQAGGTPGGRASAGESK